MASLGRMQDWTLRMTLSRKEMRNRRIYVLRYDMVRKREALMLIHVSYLARFRDLLG